MAKGTTGIEMGGERDGERDKIRATARHFERSGQPERMTREQWKRWCHGKATEARGRNRDREDGRRK